uniref:Uncharacterized protein n=1 Tax=Anopheles maculatus TaxID=74869 RepID=A0A182SDA3_9DIPT
MAGGGGEERPLSQPASLIGRDLIVPVIEEKNLPYFTSSAGATKQRAKQQQAGADVPRRSEVVDTTVQQRDSKEVQSRTRKSLISKDRQERNEPTRIADGKSSKMESDTTTKLTTTDPSLGKTCEEFETIELPAMDSDPLEDETIAPKRESKISSKGRKDDEGGSRADAYAKSYPNTSATILSRKSKPGKMIPSPDVGTGSTSSDRNDRKGSNATAQEKKHVANTGSEKRTTKRIANTPKSTPKDSRREKETSIESKRSVSPVVVVMDSDQLLLPPLEALKIDDLELFGDDTHLHEPADILRTNAFEPKQQSKATTVRQVKGEIQQGGEESDKSPVTGRSSVLDRYYDPLASDDKYEVMEFACEPSHACPDLAELHT